MAQIVVEMSSDEAKLYRGFQKIVDQQGKFQEGLKKTGRTGAETGKKLGEAGKKGQRAFGSGAVAQLRNYALGFVGIQRAVSLTTRMFTDLRQEAEEAGQKLRESFGPASELLQLAGGSPQKAKQLREQTWDIYKRGGAASFAEASKVAFELESAGAMGERQFFAQLYPIADPAVTAGAAGVMTAAMGKKEVGTFRDIVSKGFAAAGPVTRVGVAQMLEGAARAAEGGKKLGFSDEEVLAATSIVAQTMGSAEMAGTQVRSLFKALGKRGFVEKHRGKSLIEMLGVARQKGLSTPELIEFFGRAEAEEAFSKLTPELYGGRLQAIREAERTGLAQKVIQTRMAIPALALEKQRMRKVAQEEHQKEALGSWQIRADIIQSEHRKYRREKYGTGFTGRARTWFEEKGAYWEETILGPKTFAEMYELHPSGVGSAGGGGFSGDWGQAADKLNRAGENLNRAAEKLEGAAGGATLRRPNDDL